MSPQAAWVRSGSPVSTPGTSPPVRCWSRRPAVASATRRAAHSTWIVGMCWPPTAACMTRWCVCWGQRSQPTPGNPLSRASAPSSSVLGTDEGALRQRRASFRRRFALFEPHPVPASAVVVHQVTEPLWIGKPPIVVFDLRQLDHEPRITVLVEEVQRPPLVALQHHVVRLQPAAADSMPGRNEIVHHEPDVMDAGWDPGVEGALCRVEEDDLW